MLYQCDILILRRRYTALRDTYERLRRYTEGVNGVDVQATYEKWKRECAKHGRTPDEAVAWCKEQGLPADYVEGLEELISEMEGLREGQR